MVYMVKVEYVPEMNTFGQNIVVKSDQEKNKLKFNSWPFSPIFHFD